MRWPSSPRACPAWPWPGTTSTCARIPARSWSSADIRELGLNRIVVAACSPNLHEPTFRRAAEDAGLNRFLVQMANIREQVSWVTEDKAAALEKAKAHLAARHPPRRRARAAAAAVRADYAPGDGRRRRHRRHRGGPDPGGRRQGGDPRRARAVDRRPHGDVRQDLPHPRLRRLHPHAQDDRRQAASQHQAADLLRRRSAWRARWATTTSRSAAGRDTSTRACAWAA